LNVKAELMNRNTRTLIVLAVAVLMAGLASFGVFLAVRSMPVREVEIARAQAVVAARPLTVGTLLTKDDVKVVPWPAANQVPGSFTAIEKVVNRGVISPTAENEPLTESKLAPVGAGAGLPPTIPEGMRAISVKVNEVIGVAGFVIPGTRVDVMVTVKGADDKSQTRVVLSNVTVLTAGTRYDQERATKEGKPIPTSVVTLLLTPNDAEKMTLAAEEGRVMLALRNPLDVAPTQTSGARMSALLGEASPPPVKRMVEGKTIVKAAPPPAAPISKIYTVETIRAAKRSEEEVR
jgi:pilus assembly protein CpaB